MRPSRAAATPSRCCGRSSGGGRRWHTVADRVHAPTAAELARRRRRELASELERTLRAAVHRSLLGDAVVGTMCSGGLDSSLITALAVEVKPDLVAFAASNPAD